MCDGGVPKSLTNYMDTMIFKMYTVLSQKHIIILFTLSSHILCAIKKNNNNNKYNEDVVENILLSKAKGVDNHCNHDKVRRY